MEQVYCAGGCPVLVGESVIIQGNSNANFNREVTVKSVQSTQYWTFGSRITGDGVGGTIPTSYFYLVEANLQGGILPCLIFNRPVARNSGHSHDRQTDRELNLDCIEWKWHRWVLRVAGKGFRR